MKNRYGRPNKIDMENYLCIITQPFRQCLANDLDNEKQRHKIGDPVKQKAVGKLHEYASA
jgi:hypothetical protein